jgi:maltose O-acetyltransferase
MQSKEREVVAMGLVHDALSVIRGRKRNRDRVEEFRRRGVVIGERVGIETGTIIDPCHGFHVEIGNDVGIAPNVHILAHDASTKLYLNYTRIGRVKIGSRVFIGASTIILPGVVIGDDVIVGAGSVVTNDIPPESVVAGNPARVICSLQAFLDKRREELSSRPCFGAEYSFADEYGGGQNVTEKMKREMNEALDKSKFGYII